MNLKPLFKPKNDQNILWVYCMICYTAPIYVSVTYTGVAAH